MKSAGRPNLWRSFVRQNTRKRLPRAHLPIPWRRHCFAASFAGCKAFRSATGGGAVARTSGIARTKLIDDWVGQAACEIDQVVLLGAGFDTRAWRLNALASARIFEVDHPNTATVKQDRLRSAHVDLRKVTFVKVDFETDDFDGLLRAAGFDVTRPAIVVWEGVSQYLTGDAVCGVMRWVGRLAPGSRFIFTYIHEGVLNGSVAFVGADKTIAKVDGSGEPWRFGLLPEELPAFLRERGLSLLSDLGADEYRAE